MKRADRNVDHLGKNESRKRLSEDGKIEEGKYIDDRKNGEWIKYHKDGATPRLKGVYVDIDQTERIQSFIRMARKWRKVSLLLVNK